MWFNFQDNPIHASAQLSPTKLEMDLALSMHDSQRDLFPSLVIPDVKSRGTYYVQCPDCKKDVKKGTSCCGVQRGILPSICFDDTDELNHLAIDDDEPAKDMM